MAQVLKKEVRDKIIFAAKEEIFKKGYKEASMRAIARKSKMTVGNLYRYFSSKQQLLVEIVKAPMLLLDDLLKRLSDDKLTLYSQDFNLNEDVLANINTKIDVLVSEMVDIYQQHKVEFNILMMHSEVNDSIVRWCADLVKYLLVGRKNIKGYDLEASTLAQSYAVGLFSGLKEIFVISELDNERLKKLTKLYLDTCLSLFQFDIRKSLGD